MTTKRHSTGPEAHLRSGTPRTGTRAPRIADLCDSQSRGLLLASRGDALTPYLLTALAARYRVSAMIRPELTNLQRLNVAVGTFRPSRSAWSEQFYKSHRGYRMRSANASRLRAELNRPQDVVLQVHNLFEMTGARSLLYVDCTHEQSARQWPAWNPLRGAGLARWYAREQRAYAQAEHIFAFSQQTRQSLITSYAVTPERVSVVGAGANLDRLPLLAPVNRGQHDPAGTMNVLFVGNDFARKGGHVVLKAFADVHRQLPRARLQLVGTNPGIGPHAGVEVLGRIYDRERVSELYRQASVFVLPSFFDPMPLVLLEAMAYGLPCITTSSVGIPDIITHGRDGLMIPTGDAHALSQALLRMLTNPEVAARIGAAARRRVDEAFTWDHVIDRMAPVLDRMMTS